MLKQVNDVSHVINSSQTHSIPFEDYIKTHSSDTETRKTHLSDICRTRWVEHVEGMDMFKLRIHGKFFLATAMQFL